MISWNPHCQTTLHCKDPLFLHDRTFCIVLKVGLNYFLQKLMKCIFCYRKEFFALIFMSHILIFFQIPKISQESLLLYTIIKVRQHSWEYFAWSALNLEIRFICAASSTQFKSSLFMPWTIAYCFLRDYTFRHEWFKNGYLLLKGSLGSTDLHKIDINNLIFSPIKII